MEMRIPVHLSARLARTFVAGALFVALLLGLSTAAHAADGDLDPGFGTGGKVTVPAGQGDEIRALVVQPDGKTVAAGFNTGVFVLMRFNPDGTPDLSFGDQGEVTTNFEDTDRAYGLAIDGGGKLVAAGTSGTDIAVARYNPDGTPDTDFNKDGVLPPFEPGMVTTDFNGLGGNYATAGGSAVAIDGNGKIVVVGYVQNGSEFDDFAVVRYKSDGALDPDFNSDASRSPFKAGIVTTSVQSQEYDRAHGVAIQPDNKILVVGETKGTPGIFVLLRYKNNGDIDDEFGTDGKVSAGTQKVATGYAVVLQPDAKILVAGSKFVIDPISPNCIDSFGRYCEYSDVWVARFNPDGAPDTGFGDAGEMSTNVNSRGNDDMAHSLALQSDGKIILAGHADVSTHTFSSEDEFYTRTDDFALVRYLIDGTLDTSFGNGGKVLTDFSNGSNDAAYAVAIQPDGKAVAGGTSDKIFALARYKTGKTKTTTTLASAPNPSKIEQTVVFTATVNASSGTVFFSENETTLASVSLNNGVATFSTNTLSAGYHKVKATYDGNDDFFGSTSNEVTQVVSKFDTTFDLRLLNNPGTVGQELTFWACLLPKSQLQTGSLTFLHEGGALGTVPLTELTDPSDNSKCRGAEFRIDDLIPGVHSIRVRYDGDSRFNAATSPIAYQRIEGKPTPSIELRISPSTATAGTTVTMIAHAFPDSGEQTGTVTFLDGTTELGAAPLETGCGSNGVPCREAKFETNALAVGNHTITARYEGNAEFNGATSQAVVVTITSKPVTAITPITLQVDSGAKAMQLTWNVINDTAVTGYRILRTAGENDKPTTLADNVPNPFYFDRDDLVPGLTYCYVVEARRSNGTVAATSNRVCADFGSLDLLVPDTIGRPGETVIVPVNIRNADGLRITSSDIWMEFNSDVIESVAISRTALTKDFVWSSFVSDTDTPSTKRLIIAYINLQPEPLYGSGSLFWLTFRVKGQPGQNSPLNLQEFITNVGGSSIQDISNPGQDVPLTLVDGVFNVKEAMAAHIRGDVDGDGVVRAADAALVLTMVTGKSVATAAQLAAADVNGNGKIDSADSTMILAFAARRAWPVPASSSTFTAGATHGDAVVRLGSGQGLPGSTVTITIRAEDIQGIAGATFQIAYDTSVVDRVADVSVAGLFANFPALDFNDDGNGLLTIALSDQTEVSGTGELVSMQLVLRDDAPEGIWPLTLANAQLNDGFGRDYVTNSDDNTITRQSGQLVVSGAVSGSSTVFLPLIAR